MEKDIKDIQDKLEEEHKDIHSELQALKESLREKDDRIKDTELIEKIIENVAVELYLVRPDGGFVFVNEAAARSLGYTREELLKIGIAGIDPEYGPKFTHHFEELKKQDLPPFETVHIAKDGKRLYKEIKSVYLRIGDNEYVCGFGIDITEKKRIEEALFKAYREWEYIFQATGNPILILDNEHNIIDANKAVVHATGISREALIGRKCYHVFHNPTSDKPPRDCPYELMVKTKKPEASTMDVEAIDKVFMVSCTPILKDDSNIEKTIHVMTDVTEIKNVMDALKESEKRYRDLIENFPEPIVIHDGKTFILANNAALKLYGAREKEELIGKEVLDYLHPDNKDFVKEMIHRILENNIVTPFGEVRILRLDGKIVSVLTSAYPVYFDNKKCVIVNFKDISQLKEMEQALINSEKRYRDIFENAQEGFFQTTPDGRYLIANPALARIFGFDSPEEMVRSVRDIKEQYVNPEERDRLIDLYKRQGFIKGFEVELYRKDGKKIWISMTARAVKDKNGDILYYEGTTEDITQRKLAEKALRASEKKFFTAFQASPNVMAISRIEDGLYMDVNEAFIKTIGYSRSEVVGKTSKQLNIFEYPEERKRFAEKLKKSERIRNELARIRVKSGEIRIISFNADIIEIDNERYVLSSGEDITERIRIEKDLRESEERYRIFIEKSNDGIAITKGLIYIYVNKRFIEMFGYDEPIEIIGKPLTSIIHQDDKSMVEEMSRKREEGEVVPSRYEFKGVRKDGEIIFIEVSATSISYYGERMTLAFLRDITERKRLEAQLVQAQKMEAIGQLAGGVAHDFNNILTAIIGYATLMEMKMNEGDPLKSYTKQILTSANRAAQLTQGLLAFSRKQIVILKPLNIVEVVSNLRNMLARLIGEDVELIITTKESFLNVMADRVQMEHVLINLITNARDAMSKGGTITIETSQMKMDDEFIRTHQFGKPGYYALISVKDTGTGIESHLMDKIFNPFFTTKEVGKGTGLGLSIVYGIIKQHNGFIDVESELRKGTVFKIYLPLIDVIKGEDIIKEDHVIIEGGETILVCEDDETIRALVKEILEHSGYRIIESRDGDDAIKRFQEYGHVIDMVILDMVMPKKNGIEVYEEIKKIKPDIKALFISGYPKEVLKKRGMPYEELRIVQKPITPLELLKLVREVITKKEV